MDRLSELLQVYGKEQFRRATGGLYSLSGFDFELRCYLADFVQALSSAHEIEKAGDYFLEAFSDFTRQSGSELVCVQIKP